MFTRAVELDHQSKYKEAYALYCKGLQYFVALVNAECDPAKKQILHEKADAYMKRAEEIKRLGDALLEEPANSKSVTITSKSKPLARQPSGKNESLVSARAALTPTPLFTQLRNVFPLFFNTNLEIYYFNTALQSECVLLVRIL